MIAPRPLPASEYWDRCLERDRLRRRLWRRDRRCAYCRRRLSRRQAQLDHVVPLAQGGADEMSNLAIACRRCRRCKRRRTPQQWLDDLQAAVALIETPLNRPRDL